MKTIGLSSSSLFERGFAECMASSAELTYESFNDPELMKNPEDLKASIIIAREEAIIRSVALMIEENNAALLKQLKNAGVLQGD